MAENKILFEDTGAYDQVRLRGRDDLVVRPLVGYNVAEHASRIRGTYRPIRNLPVRFRKGNENDREGFVAAQGKFLMSYARLIYSGANWLYQNNAAKLGVSNTSTGVFVAAKKNDGTNLTVSFDNAYWGYGDAIEAFLAEANGTNSTIQEYFTSTDVEFNIVNPVNGNLVTAAAVSAGEPATIREGLSAANTTARLAGVCIEDMMRETRNNAYQYQRGVHAISVAKTGYLKIPFVVAATGSGFTGLQAPGTNVSTLSDYNGADGTGHIQYIASKDQAVLFVGSPADLVIGARIVIDKWGNPVLTSTTTNYADLWSVAGAEIRLTSFNFDVELALGSSAMQFPGVEVAGNQTAGIEYPIYALAKKIDGSIHTTPAALANHIKSSRRYGWATIFYDIP